jgi:hypothetical protein
MHGDTEINIYVFMELVHVEVVLYAEVTLIQIRYLQHKWSPFPLYHKKTANCKRKD